jgi:hypothetical protein
MHEREMEEGWRRKRRRRNDYRRLWVLARLFAVGGGSTLYPLYKGAPGVKMR